MEVNIRFHSWIMLAAILLFLVQLKPFLGSPIVLDNRFCMISDATQINKPQVVTCTL
jgi:hypothetical protein